MFAHEQPLSSKRKGASCERHYSSKQLPTIFKLTRYSSSAGLDSLLAQKGYELHADTCVQIASLSGMESPSIRTVRLDAKLTQEWVNAFCLLSGKDEKEKQTMSHTLGNIIPATCYASLYQEGEVVACGLGVLERGHIGLYDIVTAHAYRNRGFGKQLILNMLEWGARHGADYSYLQVLQGNGPALRLYEKLGYKEVYSYWYRIKTVPF